MVKYQAVFVLRDYSPLWRVRRFSSSVLLLDECGCAIVTPLVVVEPQGIYFHIENQQPKTPMYPVPVALKVAFDEFVN
jgi:hypothetical protein